MSNLSNANLLDENVSTNLKSERLQKTAQVAQNPNMEQSNNNMSNAEGQQMQMPPQMQQQMQMPPQMQQQMPPQMPSQMKNNNRDDNDDEVSHNLPNKNYGGNGKKEKSDDGKILGMPKGLAIGLGLVALAVGGYLLYKKFGKGAKGNSGSGSKSSNVSGEVASTPSISESIKSMDITP